ncbi:MAG: hypothetical protein GX072_03025 [Lysinibacillus sp.]|nr:hypothetical protein [Lysinibacillus sp.]
MNNNDSNGPLIEKSKVTLSPTYGELKPVQIAGTNSYISIGKSKINQKANEKLEVVWWRPLTSLNEVYKKMENGGNYKVEDLSIIIRDRTLKGNLYITTDEPYLSSVYLSNSAELTELLNNILPSLCLGDLLKTIELDELLKLLIGAKKHANGMNGQFYIENGGEQDKLLIDLLKNLKLISSTDDPNDKLLLDFLLHNGGLIPEGKAINLDPGLFANEKFNLNGVYFIEGDVKINDSIINGNAILFVNGNVDIQRSQLNTSEDKKLIIFATGDIIYRFSSNTDGQITKNYVDTNTDVVNAFLYSDRKVELHGTVSDIHIKGGISANKVILTGIRGKLKSNLIIPDMFKNPTDTNANSRLIIEHDPKVIDVVKAHLGLKEYDDIKGTFDALPYYHEVFIKPANIKSRKTK